MKLFLLQCPPEGYGGDDRIVDNRLKEIVALELLGLPQEILDNISPTMETIVIGRYDPDLAYIEPGSIFCYFGNASEISPGTYLLTVPDGPSYESSAADEPLMSGLKPVNEAKLAIAEGVWSAYFHSPQGAEELDQFITDNPEGINLSHPNIARFFELIYMPGYDIIIPPWDLAVRIYGLYAAGEIDRLIQLYELGVLNFDNFPKPDRVEHAAEIE